jgi:hypothetical protein
MLNNGGIMTGYGTRVYAAEGGTRPISGQLPVCGHSGHYSIDGNKGVSRYRSEQVNA